MKDNFLKGIIKENPVFFSLLSLCPLLATTSSVESALGMGLMTLLVLLMTNAIISLVAPIIPKTIRIPGYIVIIASVVTSIRMLTQAFLPELDSALGIFIPLIAVNCLVLGRAEAYASKNKIWPSVVDAAGFGLGLVLAFFTVGFFREFLGTGGLSFGNVFTFMTFDFRPLSEFAIPFFTSAGGSFLTLAVILAVMAYYQNNKLEKKAVFAKAPATPKVANTTPAKAAKKTDSTTKAKPEEVKKAVPSTSNKTEDTPLTEAKKAVPKTSNKTEATPLTKVKETTTSSKTEATSSTEVKKATTSSTTKSTTVSTVAKDDDETKAVKSTTSNTTAKEKPEEEAK